MQKRKGGAPKIRTSEDLSRVILRGKVGHPPLLLLEDHRQNPVNTSSAFIAVLGATIHYQLEMRTLTNSPTHFEIYGEDPEELAQFYRSTFGWQINKVPGVDYWHIETSAPDIHCVQGGLMHRAAASSNGWMFYINVGSLDKAVAEIEELGGKIVRPKTAVPKTAWVTIMADPQGNTFGIWQADSTALPILEPE